MQLLSDGGTLELPVTYNAWERQIAHIVAVAARLAMLFCKGARRSKYCELRWARRQRQALFRPPSQRMHQGPQDRVAARRLALSPDTQSEVDQVEEELAAMQRKAESAETRLNELRNKSPMTERKFSLPPRDAGSTI